MKIIQLPDVLHDYLVHVLEKHAASGIHPEEGLAISKLWEAATKHVAHIPDAEIAKMAAAGAPDGQSSVLTSESENDRVNMATGDGLS